MLRQAPLLAILVLQGVCAVYLVRDLILSAAGIYYEPLAWEYVEYLDLGAASGLIAGIVLGGRMLVLSLRERRRAEEKLRRASTAFMEVVEQRFRDWSLSPAERDVAMFAIKGMSVAETAALRGTSEGTVKAQTAAVYRKAGIGSRHQLLSLFIEDLFDTSPLAVAQPPDRSAPPLSAAAPADSDRTRDRAAER